MSKTLNELLSFAEEFSLERFNHQFEIEGIFSNYLGFDIKFDDLENERSDYLLGTTLKLDDKDLYFDVYYLLDRDDNIVITDVDFDSADGIVTIDLDKIVSPLEEKNNG